MAPLRRNPPCSTPELDPEFPLRRTREKIILVIVIQAFTGFLITRGYPVEAALAASGATVVLAHESARVAGRLRLPGWIA
jgi:uncharacterized membrane protein